MANQPTGRWPPTRRAPPPSETKQAKGSRARLLLLLGRRLVLGRADLVLVGQLAVRRLVLVAEVPPRLADELAHLAEGSIRVGLDELLAVGLG